MIFEQVKIENLRNIKSLEFTPTPGFNLITGANGVGKTALLEAIHVVVRGRSFRTNLTDSLIQHDQTGFLVYSRVHDGFRNVSLAVQKSHQQPVRMKFANEVIQRISTVAQAIPVQSIQPTIADLVFGSPRIRREWLDWGVFHQEPDFHMATRRWRRSMEQRNAALRQGDANAAVSWDASLGKYGDVVTDYRRSYLEKLQPFLDQALSELSVNLKLDLSLVQGFSGSSLTEDLKRSFKRDLQLRVTQAGPQRADVRLRLRVDKEVLTDASSTLSRGQGKIAAYAMKIAETKILKIMNKSTLYLIDDIDSELDEHHLNKLIELLMATDAQVIATTTSSPSKFTNLNQLDSATTGVFKLQEDASDLVKLGVNI